MVYEQMKRLTCSVIWDNMYVGIGSEERGLDMLKCTKCRRPRTPRAKFCGGCGASLTYVNDPAEAFRFGAAGGADPLAVRRLALRVVA